MKNNLKVLIVDDERLMRNLLKKCINWIDYDVDIIGEASSAKEGMRMIEKNRPDLIITDICMPVIDGIDFGKQIKEKYPDIKIIILTGYDELEYAKEAIKIGVDDFITKPINDEEILPAILKIKEKIAKERKHKLTLQGMKNQIDKSLNILGEKTKDDIDYEKFNFYFKAGFEKEALEIIENIFSNSKINKSFDEILQNKKNISTTLILNIFNIFAEANITPNEVFEENNKIIEHISDINNQSELKEYLIKIIKDSLKKMNLINNKKTNNVMEEIKEYLKKNISNPDISLTTIAHQFCLNPSYLSRIFKQYTGKCFLDFIADLKIDEAIRLLKETDMMAYEIGNAIGICDPHYFSIFFKKNTKKTVSSFRANLKSKN